MHFQQKRHYFIWWCETTLFKLSYATATFGFKALVVLVNGSLSCEYLIRILRTRYLKMDYYVFLQKFV